MKKIFILVISLLATQFVYGQVTKGKKAAIINQNCGISFKYDNAGNRIKRYKCVGVVAISPPYTLKTAGEQEQMQPTADQNIAGQSAPDIMKAELDQPAEDMSEMVVFPNPSPGIFNIRMDGIKPSAQVLLYDSKGSLVMQRSFNDGQFDVNELPNGTYIVLLRNGEQLKSTQLIISSNRY